MEPADPFAYHHLPHNARPPTSESTGNELLITPEFRAVTARAEGIVNREIHARKNNAHARCEMTLARKYNKHHHVQSFVVGQYVTAKIVTPLKMSKHGRALDYHDAHNGRQVFSHERGSA